jgi:predicted nucleotidyltransferase
MRQRDTPTTAPTVDSIADLIRPLVPAGHEAVLFGSRATGRAHQRSDWDIGLVGEPPVTGAVLERIREGLDALPTLHTFEVVDLASAAPEFRREALRHAVRLI